MTEDPSQVSQAPMLTFGIEVKFFAAMKAATFSRFPHDSIAALLYERMRQIRLNGPAGSGARVDLIAGEDIPQQRLKIDYSCWNLTTDKTAQPSHPEWFEYYETQPIEIISPPYTVHSPYWEHDIQRVFSSRAGQFNPIPARELRMYCEQNSSTSLHVHIGNGNEPTSEFPFHTVRNLAMILLVYEPEFDRLVDDQPTSYTLMPTGPPRAITSIHNPHFQPPNVPARSKRPVLAVHLLNTCRDVKSLIQAMNPPIPNNHGPNSPRYFKYNFTSLLDSPDAPDFNLQESNGGSEHTVLRRKPPTVEFRKQGGTMDPDTMVHWVKFLGALVDFSGKIGTEALLEFLGMEGWTEDSSKKSTPAANGDKPTTTTSTPKNSRPYSSYSSTSPSSLSAFSILTPLQPVGSMIRLLTAMESAHINIDTETARYWRRKIGSA